jgi:hypothetical protein
MPVAPNNSASYSVLVGEKRVEQLVLTCDAVNLVERQVLVVKRVVVPTLQLTQQICRRGGRGDGRAHRHCVDEQADH